MNNTIIFWDYIKLLIIRQKLFPYLNIIKSITYYKLIMQKILFSIYYLKKI